MGEGGNGMGNQRAKDVLTNIILLLLFILLLPFAVLRELSKMYK